ncbi:SigE family RNA polymerase sigma factor [Actinoplanes sp. N902-109]|uniref:SigE family RNA polymerase sigma factor n=1 Tax=Actinoplanes sp. (strain N902-109) TaxID=649831 RepID=UPI00032950EF|nr:SigE family RNA polymerase sigma factor [Actinoplanes sp. N902-109]AGL20113.1 RNA polymerase, sigma-24 subunit, ECF subfamily [Actinoplanes sp. N902-109]
MADDYREFVSARLEGFRRTAFLLCGDWHNADDLVSSALLKVLRHWRRVSAMDDPEAYVRRVLLRNLIDERRRPWRRESSWAWVPEQAVDPVDGPVTDRVAVVAALKQLPPRQRAAVVLRYFCDLSVEQTAAELGCSTGTVKSQTARALEGMRTAMSKPEGTRRG